MKTKLTIRIFLVLFIAILGFLFAPQEVQAQTAIYRSVGPSATSALTTGASNALTISGTTATFDVALADNIGVGDAIQYDSDGNGSIDAIAFIHARTSSTVYTVANAAGGTPTAVTADNDWSIFRAYTSLFNAEVGTENTGLDDAVEAFETFAAGKDIVTSDEIWNITLYANGTTADTTAVTISGWTTSATQYINIFTPTATNQVGTSQRHAGIWSTSRYHLTNAASSDALLIDTNYTRVTGLQIGTSGTGGSGISNNNVSSGLLIDSNIIKFLGGTTSQATGIYINTNNNGVAVTTVVNNIVIGEYGYDGFGGSIYCRAETATERCNVYNNTTYLGRNSLRLRGDYAFGKNNLLIGATASTYREAAGYGNLDYNAYTSGTLTLGTNHIDLSSYAATVIFVNHTGDDFHLKAGSPAIDVGTDLSGSFSTDIDGDTRSGTWDVGADEAESPTVIVRPTVKIKGGLKLRGGVKFR